MLEPSVRTGHIIPYHTVSRPALRRVTEEGLRMAGVFAPAPASAGAHSFIGASVHFSPGAKEHLPEILGGHAARGDFDVDPVTIAATIALVQASPSRKDLSRTMIREDLGFKTPAFAATIGRELGPLAGRSPQKVAAGRALRSKDKKAEPDASADDPPPADDPRFPLSPPPSDPVRIRGVLANARTSNNGAAILARIGGRFPGIREALLLSAQVTDYTTSSFAFPTEVIAEAAHAARMQEMGYEILRNSALAEAAAHGGPGTHAAFCLGAGFDGTCTDLISRGVLTLDLDPLEMLLGVLPVLQLALQVWCHYHIPPKPVHPVSNWPPAPSLSFPTASSRHAPPSAPSS